MTKQRTDRTDARPLAPVPTAVAAPLAAELDGDDATRPTTFDDIVPPVELKLGPPFALAVDCDLLPANEAAGIPGAVASVQCGACNGPFALDLLRQGVSRCPHCKAEYTHALVVTPVDAHEGVDEFMETVAIANGFKPDDDDDGGGELGDAGDDSELGDDDGDDDGDGDDGGDDDDDDSAK